MAGIDGGIRPPGHVVVGGNSQDTRQIDIPSLVGGSTIRRSILGQVIVVFAREKMSGGAPLFEIVQAGSGFRRLFGPIERRKQQAGEEGNHRDDDEQLD